MGMRAFSFQSLTQKAGKLKRLVIPFHVLQAFSLLILSKRISSEIWVLKAGQSLWTQKTQNKGCCVFVTHKWSFQCNLQGCKHFETLRKKKVVGKTIHLWSQLLFATRENRNFEEICINHVFSRFFPFHLLSIFSKFMEKQWFCARQAFGILKNTFFWLFSKFENAQLLSYRLWIHRVTPMDT